MIQTIKVFDDRKVSPSRLIVGNQFESGIERIQFELPENMLEKGYRYLILNKPSEDESYPIPLDENNIFYVDSRLTYYLKGVWIANVVLVKDEIKEDNLNPDTWTFISDNITLIVKSNYINNKYLEELPLPENLKIVYDDLLKMYDTIKRDYENGNLNGRDGKSAYELAVENGFEGTEEEWLESLRYDHSDEFTALANQVKQDAQSSADNATKAENAMNEANATAQENVEAINQASTNAQNAITTAKGNAVQAVQSAQQTAVQAVEQAQSTAETAINAKQAESVNAVETAKEEATKAIETGKTEAMTAIETAKDNAIEEIENTGVPLEDIEKLAVKETTQGNPTIISDSADWRLQKLNVYGQSEQGTTKGYQLFDSSKLATKSQGGATVTNNNDGSFTISGSGTLTEEYNNVVVYDDIIPLLKEGDIFLKTKNTTSPVFQVLFLNESYSEIGNINNQHSSLVSFNLDNEIISNIKHIQMRFFKTSGSEIKTGTIKPMLYQDGDGTWEPYTGGKLSPSLDYPQEIISKEVSEIKVTGKNKLPLPQEKQTLIKNGVTLEYDNGTFSLSGQATKDTWFNLYPTVANTTGIGYIGEEIKGKYGILSSPNRSRFSISFRKNSNYDSTFNIVANEISKSVELTESIVGIFVYIKSGSTPNFKGSIAILEENENIPEQYIPYKEQLVQLSQPITLRGIPVSSGGNITIDGQQYFSDILCEKDGIYGVDRIVKQEKINEDYTFSFRRNAERRYTSTLVENFGFYFELKQMCNCMIYAKYGVTQDNKYTFSINGVNLDISTPVDIEIDEVNSMFNQIKSEIEFYGVLKESTFEPLPENIQSQIKALKSYYTNTVIDTGAWTKIEYVADTKTWIENKINGVTELALGIGGK